MQRELTTQDYLMMLKRHWLLIAVLTLVGGAGAYGASKFVPNKFTSQSLVLIEEPTVSSELVKSFVNPNINQELTILRQEIVSPERLEPMVKQYGLYAKDAQTLPSRVLAGRLVSGVDVTAMRPPDDSSPIPGFGVAVTTDGPQSAQAVCAALTAMFIDENTRRRGEMVQDTDQVLSQHIAQAKAELDAQDAKLAAFQAAHPGTSPDSDQTNLGILQTFSSEIAAASADIAAAQRDKSLTQSLLQQQIAARQASQTGKNPQTLEEQLAALQTQLANLQSRYTDSYPDVVKTKGEIAELQKKIAESDATGAPQASKGTMQSPQVIQMQAQIRADDETIAQKQKDQLRIQAQIAQAQARIQEAPAAQEEYKRLNRDHEAAFQFYNSLLTKRSEASMAADVEKRGQSATFTLVQPASFPGSPSAPNRQLFAGGGLGAGLVIGVGLAFLMEMRDTSLRTERDVELQLQLPVIAVIPSIDLTSSNRASRQALNATSRGLLGEGS